MSLFNDAKKSQLHHNLVIATLIVSSVSLVLAGVAFFRPSPYQALVQMETLKAGGEDNRTSLQNLYTSEAFKAKTKESIDSTLQQLGQAGAPTQQPQADSTTPMTLSSDEIEAITKNAAIEGNKNADIMIVEYTDPECPFCIRHNNDGTVAKTMEAFPNSVGHIIKVVQWVNHTNTQSKSLAIICAGKVGSSEDSIALYKKIISASTVDSPVAMDKLPSFYSELGLSQSKMDSCVTETDTMAIYTANRQEAQKMGQTGTPGNIILNVKTGKYVALAGAYPADAFIEAVKQVQ